VSRPHISDGTKEAVAARIEDRTGDIDAGALPFDRQVELLIEAYDEVEQERQIEQQASDAARLIQNQPRSGQGKQGFTENN
jgi:hypothetical protein